MGLHGLEQGSLYFTLLYLLTYIQWIQQSQLRLYKLVLIQISQRNILPPNLFYPADGDKTFLRNLISTYHITTQKTWTLTLVIRLVNAEFEWNHTIHRGNISGLIQLKTATSHPMGLGFSPKYSCENRGEQSGNEAGFSNFLLFSPVNQHSVIAPHSSEVCDSPDRWAHYNILNLFGWGPHLSAHNNYGPVQQSERNTRESE
jgi:hypothetical protein